MYVANSGEISPEFATKLTASSISARNWFFPPEHRFLTKWAVSLNDARMVDVGGLVTSIRVSIKWVYTTVILQAHLKTQLLFRYNFAE